MDRTSVDSTISLRSLRRNEESRMIAYHKVHLLCINDSRVSIVNVGYEQGTERHVPFPREMRYSKLSNGSIAMSCMSGKHCRSVQAIFGPLS